VTEGVLIFVRGHSTPVTCVLIYCGHENKSETVSDYSDLTMINRYTTALLRGFSCVLCEAGPGPRQ
jgi:hypothetical protein